MPSPFFTLHAFSHHLRKNVDRLVAHTPTPTPTPRNNAGKPRCTQAAAEGPATGAGQVKTRKLPDEFSVNTASVWPPIGCMEKVCRRGTEAGLFSRPSVTASSLVSLNETCTQADFHTTFQSDVQQTLHPRLFLGMKPMRGECSLVLLLTSGFPFSFLGG